MLRFAIVLLPLLVDVTIVARQAMPPVAAPVTGAAGGVGVARIASVATPSPPSTLPVTSDVSSPAQLGTGAVNLGTSLVVTPSTKAGSLITPFRNTPSANSSEQHVKALQVNETETDGGGDGGGGGGGGGKNDSLQSLSSVSLPLSITAIIGLSVGSVACAALLGIILYSFVRCCCAGKKKKNTHAVLHSSEELNEAHAEGAQGAEPSTSPAMEEANAVTSSQPIVPLEASDNLALPSKSLNDLDAQAAGSQPSAPNAELITVSKEGELVPVTK